MIFKGRDANGNVHCEAADPVNLCRGCRAQLIGAKAAPVMRALAPAPTRPVNTNLIAPPAGVEFFTDYEVSAIITRALIASFKPRRRVSVEARTSLAMPDPYEAGIARLRAQHAAQKGR